MNKLTDAKLKLMRDRYDRRDKRGMVIGGSVKKGRKGTGNKVPIYNIEIMWHEGTNDGPNLEGKTYSDWYDYQNALKKINDDNKKDRPKGTYTKTKARFTWADGTQEEARIDLGKNDFDPDYKTRDGTRMYIGDYYRRTLRDGKRGEDGRWRAFSPPKYIKSRTGRELGTGYQNDNKLDKDGWAKNPHNPKNHYKHVELPNTPSANKVKTTIVPSGTGFECKPSCGWCGTNKCKAYKEWNAKRIKQNNKGKESRKEQPPKVLGSYSSKGHRPQKSKPYSSKGPGSGWHGQIARHRMAAMKGRRR